MKRKVPGNDEVLDIFFEAGLRFQCKCVWGGEKRKKEGEDACFCVLQMKQKGHCVRRGRIINKRRGGETGAGGRGWESNIVYNDIYVGRCHNRAYCSVCQQKKNYQKKVANKKCAVLFWIWNIGKCMGWDSPWAMDSTHEGTPALLYRDWSRFEKKVWSRCKSGKQASVRLML